MYMKSDILGNSLKDQEKAKAYIGKLCYFGNSEEDVLLHAKIDFRKNPLYIIDDTYSEFKPYGYEFIGFCPHYKYIIPCKEVI